MGSPGWRAAARAACLGLVAGAAAGREVESGLDPAKAVTQYSIDVWTTENGLPQNTVNAVQQTPDGYLWFGTYEGLARFDGVRFTVFRKGRPEALREDGVRSLCVDRDGALWIGTNGGGLTRLARGAFTNHSPAEGPGNDMIWALEPDPEGGVLVGTNAGNVYRLRGERFETIEGGAGRQAVYALELGRRGDLWVGTQGGGLRHRATDGTWRTWTTRDGLRSDFVRSLREDDDGSLWIGTLGGGLSHLADGRIRSWGVGEGLPDDVISDVRKDRNGTLWLATRRGVVRWRDGRADVLGEAQGLAHDVAYALFEDREGSLWVGSAGGGASRLRDGSFTTFTTREGLPDNYIYPIFEDPEGIVWVGTGRGLARLAERRFQRFTTADGLCHDVVRSLWSGAPDDVWVGTYGGGVCRRRQGRWTRYTTAEGLVHDSVRAVLGTRDGSLWAGTVGGLGRLRDGRWRRYATADGLPVDSVITLAEDGDGTLWVGTDGGGLARRRDDRFEPVPGRLPSNVVLALLPDRDGSLWVGTTGGLARLVGARVQAITAREGLPADPIHQIVDDGQGHLWIGGSHGVYRLPKHELDELARGERAAVAPHGLGKSQGMRSVECTTPALPAGLRTRDGRLWFATTRGIAVLDPSRLRIGPEPAPPVVIEALVADDRPLETRSGEVRLDPGTSRVAFQYTGLTLLEPERVRFRYRLLGYDQDWVEAGDRRGAHYTGLPPGSYRFEVMARVGAGPWSDAPAALGVSLEPRFHQTRWFWAAAGGLLFLGLVAAHRARIARHTAHERELAVLVDERTRSLQSEKERAEAARREAERQTRVAQQADALKTEVLGIAAHDLRNPLQNILGYAEVLGGADDAKVKGPATAIERASERMLRLIEDLLATAALDGGVELRPERLELGRVAALVVEGNRARAEAKGQALSFAVEEVVWVHADAERLRDVIENLVSNAIKYTPPGGHVRLAVTHGEGLARLEVWDDGQGLAPDEMPRLFGRFERLAGRPTAGEPSTGLGLYIVRRLVELHGGRVWAESEGRGRGARFVVELPAADRAAGVAR
jgi:signal transduction histidine kinase/ligand-binding sensor domain-containing protein